MKRIVLVGICLLMARLSSAQYDVSGPLPAKTNMAFDTVSLRPVIKFALLSLYDLTPTWQFALEIPVYRQLSIQQEVGYGWDGMLFGGRREIANPNILAGNRLNTWRVWRFRTEVRYYFRDRWARKTYTPLAHQDTQRKRVNATVSGQYVALEGMYKAFTFPGEDRVTQAAHAKVGYQFVLNRQKNFVLDCYVGGGIRRLAVTEFYSSGSIRQYSHTSPSISAGVKFGLTL